MHGPNSLYSLLGNKKFESLYLLKMSSIHLPIDVRTEFTINNLQMGKLQYSVSSSHNKYHYSQQIWC